MPEQEVSFNPSLALSRDPPRYRLAAIGEIGEREKRIEQGIWWEPKARFR